MTAKKNAVPRHLDLVTEVARSSKNVARGSAVMWLAMYRPIWIASARSVTVLNDGCLSLFAFPRCPENLLSDWQVNNLPLLATAGKKGESLD